MASLSRFVAKFIPAAAVALGAVAAFAAGADSGGRSPVVPAAAHAAPPLDFGGGFLAPFQSGAGTLPELAAVFKRQAVAGESPERLAPLSAMLTAALDPDAARRAAAVARVLAGVDGRAAIVVVAQLQASTVRGTARDARALRSLRALQSHLDEDAAVAALARGFDGGASRPAVQAEDAAPVAKPSPDSLAEALLTARRKGGILDPLAVAVPKDILRRPTRLQGLLEKTHFDKLKASGKAPEIQELFSESGASKIAWRDLPIPAFAAADYVGYFSLDDLIYMAADRGYAKKIAGDLRNYANLKMHGRTEAFANDVLYWAARVLVERWRVKAEGFAPITDEARLREEARRAGAKAQVRAVLYLGSALAPEAVQKAGTLRNAPAPRTATVVEGDARLAGYDPKGKNESLRPAYMVLREQDEPRGSVPLPKKEAKALLVKALKSGRKDLGYDAGQILESAEFHGKPLASVITEIWKAETGYQYEVEKLTAVKAGTLNENWIAPEVPTAKIKRWRRVHTIDCVYEMAGHVYRGERLETRNAYFHIAEEWQPFVAAAPSKAAARTEPSAPGDAFSASLIPEDRQAWASLKPTERVQAFVLLDSSEVDAAVRRALAGGATEKSLYAEGSSIRMRARALLASVEFTAAPLREKGLRAITNYDFRPGGSVLMVMLLGAKGQIIQALGPAKTAKAWLARPGESLAGNRLFMRHEQAWLNAALCVSTVYLRKGTGHGYAAGPGQIDLKDSNKVLPVYFESVEERPFSKVDAEVLNGLAPGQTWDDMFKQMQGYYPGFTAADVVTVIRYRRR